MSRLCERPGCSEPGAVAYGMIPENLLFWIAPIAESPVDDPPVMCRRHADLMVVPRGWTLDDRRERFPRLFTPRPLPKAGVVAASPAALQTAQQATQTAHPHHTRRRRARPEQMPEQLMIDGTGEIPRPAVEPVVVMPPAIEPEPEPEVEPEPEIEPEVEAQVEVEPGWTPDFNIDDTLNGLLKAKSPLLARAFRGTGRRR